MKVRLLTNGGFDGFDNFNFDTEIEAKRFETGAKVLGEYLIKGGADPEYLNPETEWCFFSNEFEEVK